MEFWLICCEIFVENGRYRKKLAESYSLSKQIPYSFNIIPASKKNKELVEIKDTSTKHTI